MFGSLLKISVFPRGTFFWFRVFGWFCPGGGGGGAPDPPPPPPPPVDTVPAEITNGQNWPTAPIFWLIFWVIFFGVTFAFGNLNWVCKDIPVCGPVVAMWCACGVSFLCMCCVCYGSHGRHVAL